MKRLQKFYKLARPDGFDFYTGKTINYRESVGKDVFAPKFDKDGELCSSAFLHASRAPEQCFVGASMPCSAYIVYGKPLLEDDDKAGFEFLHVDREVAPEKLFKWNYSLAANPILPFHIIPPKKITQRHLILLSDWDSVRDLVRDSVWDSVRDLVRDSVWDSVRASVRDSVWDSVWASVGDSVWASVGEIFIPVIKKWKYTDRKNGTYPFQPSVDLFRLGLVPCFDGNLWRLVSKNGIEWTGEKP